MTDLAWLPQIRDWRQRLRSLAGNVDAGWDSAIALANARLNFVLTNALDETVRRVLPQSPAGLAGKPVRLAALGSATLTHLLPAIRVAGLRRGLWVDTYEGGFGQYHQQLCAPESGLAEFQPTAILLSLDAWHLSAGVTAGMTAADAGAALDEAIARIRDAWAWRSSGSAARSCNRPYCPSTRLYSEATSIACRARAPTSSRA